MPPGAWFNWPNAAPQLSRTVAAELTSCQRPTLALAIDNAASMVHLSAFSSDPRTTEPPAPPSVIFSSFLFPNFFDCRRLPSCHGNGPLTTVAEQNWHTSLVTFLFLKTATILGGVCLYPLDNPSSVQSDPSLVSRTPTLRSLPIYPRPTQP
jgi:hypothetical protein